MFKKSLLAAAFLAFSQLTLAGSIVVFDHEEALLKTKSAKQKIEQLKAKPEYARMLTQAESLRADLEALSKEASSKGLTWSDAEKAEQRKKIEYIQADLKLAAQKLQAENSALMQAISVEMQPKLQKALTTYIDKKDIDLVLRKQVSYISKPAADITADITAEIDKLK
ncbi:OmpH family outer membrane protein [Agarilytica rhodophyticola]|uniref:OmpH family outer membrane protein n=1 Tax=Agarilytica rhodophyticola TaxID=1737490 RepID=UPI000B347D08|nr:OmpH family outer membrane protein [Agarilytica rhodophyticola]